MILTFHMNLHKRSRASNFGTGTLNFTAPRQLNEIRQVEAFNKKLKNIFHSKKKKQE
jgi:hypothetical protein